MLVTEVLAEAGYTSIEAADAKAGLLVLHSDARIDLLVTDIDLPGGMNGRLLADAARALRPNLKVLFIAGYAENALVGDGRLVAGHGRVDQALRGRRSGSSDSGDEFAIDAVPGDQNAA